MHDQLKNSQDFSVRLLWNGHEDKPFYRAHLVSASRRERLVDKPFWGNAVISREEYKSLFDILEQRGLEIDVLSHKDKFGYSMEFRTNDRLGYCYLGLTEETLQTLNLMRDALAPENRHPLQAILDRLQGIML
ncbi:MAG: hypothetical protein KKA54_02845 [Proteobacteria bacterium]|nr:hypothetical protein [Pseudomonadota bacterium]MBU0965298.1 hypothetical protein [Pseudomonadota bacterium]